MSNSSAGTLPAQLVRHCDLGPLAYMRPDDMVQPFMYVRDEKAQGTYGGNTTGAGYYDRTLNTVVVNTIPAASLSSNQITLPPGTYDFEIITPFYSTTAGSYVFRANLYNVTDSAIVAYGPIGSAAGSDTVCAKCRVTISATKTFKVQTYCTAALTNALGYALNVSGQVEIYSEVRIYKVS
ncbi:hypothetical protein GJ700_12750 [Duganella sp. FT92W]|uniref:Uncharacterized protein n=1 Tax=Pseudoduganella rivuli TaxID=2666085 RepID=A0A7X2IN12_9BURK|nr:hypothetical protein [Pseudoduganella rivuli]MRV72577.1 hypothetical protein [Pseudoduganella rivuli]